MLSKEDYNNEIGKNIFIYPLDNVRILGNSIDLTASKYAWTSDGKYIYDDASGQIIVPPNQTACVLTNEAIYVKSNIGGTYHSRVSLVQKGFAHIGTMLDPEYCGQSLITLHNVTNKELTIDVKKHERIVSIIFYYLNTPILVESHHPNPGHSDKLQHFEKIDEYKIWCDNNPWVDRKSELVSEFMRSEGYKKFIEKREIDEQAWDSTWSRNIKLIQLFFNDNLKSYIILIFICIITYLIWFNVIGPSGNDAKSNFIAIIVGALISRISSDIK